MGFYYLDITSGASQITLQFNSAEYPYKPTTGLTDIAAVAFVLDGTTYEIKETIKFSFGSHATAQTFTTCSAY